MTGCNGVELKFALHNRVKYSEDSICFYSSHLICHPTQWVCEADKEYRHAWNCQFKLVKLRESLCDAFDHELEYIIQVARILGGDDPVSILNEETEKLILGHRTTFIKEDLCLSLLYFMGNLSDFQEC